MQSAKDLRLGLRENLGQFSLLVLINAFVGAMVGLERTILPLLAERDFGLASKTTILSFIVSFGITKAFANLLAGSLSDKYGRKHMLVFGWLFGLPVPFLVIFAPSWNWVVFANILLGINQGLCWSTTVVMKIDLVGPQKRGLAMGLNEFAGYLSVAFAALASGYIAAKYGLRPQPFYLGIAFAVLGLFLSIFLVKDTRQHVSIESNSLREKGSVLAESKKHIGRIFAVTSWKDKTLFGCSQAGMVNNLNDGMVRGLLPIYFASFGFSVAQVGQLAAIYPGVWGFLQLFTGAWSDRIGRKPMIMSGMWIQAAGILLLAAFQNYAIWIVGLILLGTGTALSLSNLACCRCGCGSSYLASCFCWSLSLLARCRLRNRSNYIRRDCGSSRHCSRYSICSFHYVCLRSDCKVLHGRNSKFSKILKIEAERCQYQTW